jgi:hypothetical protein
VPNNGMTNEWERMSKKAIMAYSDYYHNISLAGLSKTEKNLQLGQLSSGPKFEPVTSQIHFCSRTSRPVCSVRKAERERLLIKLFL